jgi:hypothetical protein
MNCLIGPENVCGGDAGPRGTDIQRLGQLDELGAGNISSPQEDGDL